MVIRYRPSEEQPSLEAFINPFLEKFEKEGNEVINLQFNVSQPTKETYIFITYNEKQKPTSVEEEYDEVELLSHSIDTLFKVHSLISAESKIAALFNMINKLVHEEKYSELQINSLFSGTLKKILDFRKRNS